MKEIIVFYISKLIKRMQVSSKRRCHMGRGARVMSGGLYYDVDMGKYSYAGYNCSIVNCVIGNYCSIANNTNIGGGSHPISHVSTSPVFHQGKNVTNTVFFAHPHEPSSHTVIGHDVWIGFGSIIKAGVTIGTGSVVGAGSVVTKNIPPYEIWAGNPAKFIRARFSREVSVRLLESEWWNQPDHWISNNAVYFSNPEKFLEQL